MISLHTTHVTKQHGFTLIELMIVVAIIAILAAIALPQYTQYTKKAKFSEIITMVSAYKLDVAMCANNSNSLMPCDAGAFAVGWSIKPNQTTPVGNTASITVVDGVITATAVNTNGLNGETYIATPSLNPGGTGVAWNISGTCTNSPRIC